MTTINLASMIEEPCDHTFNRQPSTMTSGSITHFVSLLQESLRIRVVACALLAQHHRLLPLLFFQCQLLVAGH